MGEAKLIPAGDHGGDGARLAVALGVSPDEVLDLSASLNPLAPDPSPIIAAHSGAARRYPDQAAATDALAKVMAVDPERLVLTNGGSEAIALVAEEMPRGWVEEPEFSLYRRHLSALDPTGPRWRSNPHNPTGRLAAADEHAEVWDEAFWPLASGTWTRGDGDRGSVVLGSLTKVLGCPGLRVGYVLCPDAEFAKRVRERQPLWSVNGIALAALPDLLARVDLPGWAAGVSDLRQRLIVSLHRHGLDVRPSEANWVLVDAPGLRDQLARSAICVRDCTSFGMAGTVRIAVPDDAGIQRIEAAL